MSIGILVAGLTAAAAAPVFAQAPAGGAGAQPPAAGAQRGNIDPANPFGDIDIGRAGATPTEITTFVGGLSGAQVLDVIGRCNVIHPGFLRGVMSTAIGADAGGGGAGARAGAGGEAPAGALPTPAPPATPPAAAMAGAAPGAGAGAAAGAAGGGAGAGGAGAGGAAGAAAGAGGGAAAPALAGEFPEPAVRFCETLLTAVFGTGDLGGTPGAAPR